MAKTTFKAFFGGQRAFQRQQSASVLLFVWGTHLLPVFLTSVRVTEKAHLPSLIPYRANVTLQMQVIEGDNPFYKVEKVRQVASALAREPAALAAARLFVRLLGRFAGDTALTFKALGGVYITGGVACGLGPLLEEPQFRQAFEAHPPYETLLAALVSGP